jgi:hypothetical protein
MTDKKDFLLISWQKSNNQIEKQAKVINGQVIEKKI